MNHAELPPRSFFNADDLSLLIMEHPDAPQFLAVKIADAHDAAIAALVAERDALREALEYLAADVEAAHVSGALNSPPPTEHERANLARARAALAQGGGEKP